MDADGFTYQCELGAYEGGQIDTVDLAPGEKVRGWIAYQLPDGAQPATVKYRSGLFGGVVATAAIE